MSEFASAIEDCSEVVRWNLLSLGSLENISNQILLGLLSSSINPQFLIIVSNKNSVASNELIGSLQYLIDVFKSLLKLYKIDGESLFTGKAVFGEFYFKDAIVLKNLTVEQRLRIVAILRKANAVICILTYLEVLDHDPNFLQTKFLDVFAPLTGADAVHPVEMFLEAKCQLYIDSLKGELQDDLIDRDTKEKYLDLLFNVSTFPNELLLRKAKDLSSFDLSQLTSNDRALITAFDNKRTQVSNYSSLKMLTDDFDKFQFISNLLDYSKNNLSMMITGISHQPAENATESEVLLYLKNFLFTVTKDILHLDNDLLCATDTEYLMDSQIHNNVTASSIVFDGGLVVDTHSNTDPLISTKTIADAALAVNKKPKTKRTWSKYEEDALVDGLKSFGPSWVKILEFHGETGKFSNALRNRSQVQLKDKARNWKLQYLKTGTALPVYLQRVTGSIDKISTSSPSTQARNLSGDDVHDETHHKVKRMNINGSRTSPGIYGHDPSNSNEATGYDPNLTPSI